MIVAQLGKYIHFQMKIPTADYKLIGTDIKSSVVNTTDDF